MYQSQIARLISQLDRPVGYHRFMYHIKMNFMGPIIDRYH